jgi:hypothetical protein
LPADLDASVEAGIDTARGSPRSDLDPLPKACHEPCHELRNSVVIPAHLKAPQMPAATRDRLESSDL